MAFLSNNFRKIHIAHSWLILSLFLFIDSYIGLRFGSAFLSWTGIQKGDILWILQSLEMMAFGIVIVNKAVKSSTGKFKALALVATPVFLFLLALFTLDTLLKGKEITTIFYYNLSSISLSALYWSAA